MRLKNDSFFYTTHRFAGGYVSDAGFDLPSSEDITVSSHPAMVPTGIRIRIPPGYYGRIVPRSSSNRRGLVVLEGTIDADYIGELFVVAFSLGGDQYIKKGTRVAQLIIQAVVTPNWVVVSESELPDEGRGHNGFGSTGV